MEIAASNATVSALLDYVYGGQPEVNLEAGFELLRLAEAYDLPKLAWKPASIAPANSRYDRGMLPRFFGQQCRLEDPARSTRTS